MENDVIGDDVEILAIILRKEWVNNSLEPMGAERTLSKWRNGGVRVVIPRQDRTSY